ncbi:DUF3574 domain-containing protein [Pantoea septica]|uniref:DUF3574 domain-containing protein n=1 Tax=Pantoea septica TaxID=472695 RepID=UPI0023F4BE12|nr:DUF3574 domain-containing protein [Pantoea septica]
MFRSVALSVALAALLAGCQAPRPLPPPTKPIAVCAGGEMMMQTTLWFGLSKPQGGMVSRDDWQQFLDKEVTPRFKAGLSVYDASGQWMEKSGKLAREPSKALMLIHGAENGVNDDIEALRTLYKLRFGQESVMRVDAPVCVGF